MEMVTAKAGISVLVMLFGFFQDGLKKLEQKDYPSAIVAFTKVIEHEQADADLRGQALLWRAMAYGKSGKLPEAKADLARMLAATHDDALRQKAFTAFAELGGDPKDLLPKETPKEAFERTKERGLARDIARFRQRLDGGILGTVGAMERIVTGDGHGDPGEAISALLKDMQSEDASTGVGTGIGSAQASVLVDRGRLRLTLGLVPTGDEWQFASLLAAKSVAALPKQVVPVEMAVKAVGSATPAAAEQAPVAVGNEMKAKAMAEQAAKAAAERAAAAHAEAVARKQAAVAAAAQVAEAVKVEPVSVPDDQAGKLKKLVTAVALFASQKGGTFPKELDEVKPMLGDDAGILAYTDPATKGKLPLLYHRDGSGDPTVAATRYLIATPVPNEGRRLVAFADGRVSAVPEEEFLRTAKEQGWQDLGVAALLPEKELKTKVARLVDQLGDAAPGVRKSAYKELWQLRKQAEPILETYRDHPDPEVRMSVRKLLKKKTDTTVNPNAGGMGMGGMGGPIIWGE